MGADINVEGRTAIIQGVEELSGDQLKLQTSERCSTYYGRAYCTGKQKFLVYII